MKQQQTHLLPCAVPSTQETLPVESQSFVEINSQQNSHLSPDSQQGWGLLVGNHVELVLTKDVYSIGRHRDEDIQLSDCVEVSNHHCRIYRDKQDGFAYLQDLSLNGTRINGKKMEKNSCLRLAHQDIIEIKQAKFYAIYLDRKMANNQPLMEVDRWWVMEGVVIGTGAYAVVKMAVKKDSGLKAACKIIHRPRLMNSSKISPKNVRNQIDPAILREVEIVMQLSHPNIVKIYDFIQGGNGSNYLMMELVSGGELFDYINLKKVLPEAESKFIFYQLLLAVQYMHHMNISHRDLKPENILIYEHKSYPRVAITDFGMAKIKAPNTILKSFCGTLSYIAPEILQKSVAHIHRHNRSGNNQTADDCMYLKTGYSLKVDCWSLGVILFLMLAGYLPFPDDDEVVLNSSIIQGHMHFHPDDFERVSDEAQDLIQRMIVVEPNRRYSVDEAIKHAWIDESILDLQTLYRQRIL